MNKFELYDVLIDNIKTDAVVKKIKVSKTNVYIEDNLGHIAKATLTKEFNLTNIDKFVGTRIDELAKLIKSWDFDLAAIAMAAINTYYNRIEVVGIDNISKDSFIENETLFRGKKVGVIGHFKFLEQYFNDGKTKIYCFERVPQAGDYPDSAIEYLIDELDVLFITGTTIINKTIVRLLELASKKTVILVGFSTPMCEKLFNYGIDELAGTSFIEEKEVKVRLVK